MIFLKKTETDLFIQESNYIFCHLKRNMINALLCRRFCKTVRLSFEPKLGLLGRKTTITVVKENFSRVTQISENSSTSTEEIDAEERKIALTSKEQKLLIRRKPLSVSNSRLLKVAILGAPNAGKSTLANKLIGWKFAPVSQKVHTTRHKTIGVLTEDNKQVIFLDTPGVIGPRKMKQHKLEKTLLVDPHSAVFDADLLAVVVDVSYVWNRSRLDEEILKILHFHSDKRSVLVLNKVDLVKNKRELLGIARNLTEGVVGGTKSWSTAKQPKKISLSSLFEKMKLRNGSSAENSNTAVATLENISQEEPSLNSNSQCAAFKNSKPPDDELEQNLSGVDRRLEEEYTPAVTVTVDSRSNVVLNLHDERVWTSYYKEVQSRSQELDDKNGGWQHFDEVFMISALSGDGVFDLREYLLNETYRSSLHYHPSVVTDQNPVDLARLCVFERMLDHLPNEIPYQVKLKLALWEVTEDDLLRVSFEITCLRKRHLQHVLGDRGQTIRTIAAEAKQQLMNAFRREMSLQLTVKGIGDFYKCDEE